ncbi:hypothetical protein GCM10027053_25490 [Intrasporangium mesophilum]
MNRAKLVVTVAAVLLAVDGCTSAELLGSRGVPAPIVLRLGTSGSPGSASGDVARYFGEIVREETGGEVEVDVIFEAGREVTPAGAPVWEDSAITTLKQGKVDLALVPARAWDLVGESSFRVLQTPFLIRSDAAAAAVARSDAALAMLASLSSSGLAGMALIPQGLRHVASFGGPMLEPADFRGVPTRAPLSASTYGALRAMGLVPKDLSDKEFITGAGTGEVGATEASFADYPDLPGAVVYTGNVTPYAEFDVLAMRASAFAKLRPEQRDLMMSLAWRALDHTLATTERDAAAADEYCERGGAIVLAPASTLSAFELAARPEIEGLERDPVTGPALAAVRSVVASVPEEPLQHGCVPGSPTEPATVTTPVGSRVHRHGP